MKTWPRGGFNTAKMQHISPLSEKKKNKTRMSTGDSLTSCQYPRTAPTTTVNKLNVQFISPTLGDSISN